MDKNVIPNTSTKFTGDTNTYFKRRSHITMFFRRLTPFWNTEMPHNNATKPNFWPHLNKKSKDVERRHWSTNTQKPTKNANVHTWKKNYKPVVWNPTSTLQPKIRQITCHISNPTILWHIKTKSTLFNNGGKSRIALMKKNRYHKRPTLQ